MSDALRNRVAACGLLEALRALSLEVVDAPDLPAIERVLAKLPER